MLRLVIGTALGFMVAQAVLHVLNRIAGWVRYADIGLRLRKISPVRGSAFLGGFIKYASLLGGSAALITFGVWSVEDYMAAKATRTAATLKVPDISAVAPEPDPKNFKPAVAVLPEPPAEADVASDTEVDPYGDAQFKVKHVRRRGGAQPNLKDALIERSEAKARDDLLQQTRQHALRSQYDCEAADRAARYVKAGLDVWGFTAWQLKYFPTENYKGARLEACKDIRSLLDPGSAPTQSTVAQQNHP
jgi:hypothetical protein